MQNNQEIEKLKNKIAILKFSQDFNHLVKLKEKLDALTITLNKRKNKYKGGFTQAHLDSLDID